jgi:hypothetical protein
MKNSARGDPSTSAGLKARLRGACAERSRSIESMRTLVPLL